MKGFAALPGGGKAYFPCSKAIWLAILGAACVLPGCATYSSSFSAIESDLGSQQYDAALQGIEKQSESSTDRVLYLLDKGMVLRMKRDFAASNQALEAAKMEMERLYAASVSENALSFVVNDATVSYAGDPYEQVLVHVYMALNYLELGEPDDARVEVLQANVKLREIAEKDPAGKITGDAFSRYLAGLVYDDSREWSDAMISYRQAYQTYKQYDASYGLAVPDMLKHDLLRLATQQGLTEEAAQYSREFGIAPAQRDHDRTAESGELIFVLSNGLAPIKREHAVHAATANTGVLVRIAVPYYESRANNVVSARISTSGKEADTEPMENIDAIARATLDAHMPAIIARGIAREGIKIAATNAAFASAGNNNDAVNLLGGVAVQVAALTTERADTRSWLTLPANIQLARLRLPTGSYTIKVELLGANRETVATTEYAGVVIAGAHKTYLTQHWIPPKLATTRREP